MQEQELLSTRPHLPTSAMTLYQLVMRIVLATVCYRSGSPGLVITLNFCSDFEHFCQNFEVEVQLKF